uniref:Uncharacterized protein n=1 Tax=Cacopsylla melanoneura TaxID=428564 RepID=A0A8D8ULX1_9HEMI
MEAATPPRRAPVRRRSSAGFYGKTLHGQTREMVNNVRLFFEAHANDYPGNPIDNTVAAAKVGRTLVYRIKKENSNEGSCILSTPSKKKNLYNCSSSYNNYEQALSYATMIHLEI